METEYTVNGFDQDTIDTKTKPTTTSTPAYAIYESRAMGKLSRTPVATAEREDEAMKIANNLNAKSVRRYVVRKLVSL